MATLPSIRAVNRGIGAVGRWFQVILVLLPDSLPRRGRSGFGAALLIVEPFVFIFLFALPRQLLLHEGPRFRGSDMLFLVTGVIPFFLFLHLSRRMRRWEALGRFPRATEFDLMVVQICAEFLIKIFALFLCYAIALYLAVPEALPVDLPRCFVSLCYLALLGTGLGMSFTVIAGFFPLWRLIASFLTRATILLSGVHVVADYVPSSWLREILLWNPIAHAITLFRSGHYRDYPTMTMDVEYLTLCTVLLLSLSWLVYHSTRAWRMD